MPIKNNPYLSTKPHIRFIVKFNKYVIKTIKQSLFRKELGCEHKDKHCIYLSFNDISPDSFHLCEDCFNEFKRLGKI